MRKGLLASVLVGILLVFATAPRAEAQAALVLSDWDQTGLDVVFAALIIAGSNAQGGGVAYYANPPNWTSSGSLEDGSLSYSGAGGVISRVWRGTGTMRFNDNGASDAINIGAFFATGAGADTTVYVTTGDGDTNSTVSFPSASNVLAGHGGNWVNFDPPAAFDTAFAAIGDGDRFVIAVARPDASSAPDAPTSLSADPANASIVLSWTAPTNTGSEALTDYEYCTFADCAPAAAWATLGTTTETATITQTSAATFPTAFTNGTAVTVRIRAVNSVGASTATGTVTATPRAPSAPGAPTGFTATAEEDQVALAWTAPSVDHDETITRYEYSTNNGTNWRTTGSTTTSYTATQTSAGTPVNLVNGTSYVFRVRAVNSTGNGTQSASASATPYGEPGAPTGLAGSAGDQEIVLSWTAAPANGQAITRYEYSTNNGTNWRTTGSTTTGYTATQTSAATPVNLVNGTSYVIRVRAVNSAGTGPQSGSVTVAPSVVHTVPGTPTSFTVTTADASLVLSWTAPGDGGSAITDYEYCTFATCTAATWASLSTTSSPATITQTSPDTFPQNLGNNQQYFVRIRAVNSVGAGAATASVSGTPRAAPQVSSVGVLGVTTTTVTFVANLSNAYSQSITVLGRYRPTGGAWVNLASQTTTGTQVTWSLTGLTAGEEYEGEASKSGGTVRSHTWTQKTTVALTAAPGTVERLTNHELSLDVSAGVSNVDVSLTETGDITLAATEADLDCNSQTNALTVAASGNFWFRGCDSGSVTITLTDADDTTVTRDYTATVSDVLASLSSISVGSIAQTTATITATLANSDSQSVTVYCRWRISGTWLTGSESTTGTTVAIDIASLSSNGSYSVECSLANDYSGAETATFTTLAVSATIDSLSVGSITQSGATFTVTLTNPDSQSATVSARYRTPPASGAWTTLSAQTVTSVSVDFTLSGLARETSYRVQASLDSFVSTETEIFTTQGNNAPSFVSTSYVREVRENALAGALVGDPITATDADGDTITYSLTGTEAVSFAVGASTGQITVATGAVLDYETEDSYGFSFVASDGGDTATVNVTVNIVDILEAGLLASFTVEIDSSGNHYGYSSGSYGTLSTGEFPGQLFNDGTERTIDSIYEDEDGHWYFVYSGGDTDDWNNEGGLDTITVIVRYEDGIDQRSFVIGGFVDERIGDYTLKTIPPLPSGREWDQHTGEEIIIEFRRVVAEAVTRVITARVPEPTFEPDSFLEFLQETTPGGGVLAQAMIVFVVFAGFVLTSKPTQDNSVFAAICLVTTPWIPVIFGLGSTIMASIIFINVLAGAFAYKAFAARTES